MQIRLRIKNKDGIMRVENATKMQEVMVNEDMLHPEQESIALGFKNQDSSGIIEFTVSEFEEIYRAVKSKAHILTSNKIFGTGGSYVFEKK